MIGQRGFSLLELLVAAMLTTVVAGALLSVYIATARSLGESSAQAALQRQGTLVLEEIGRQVRGAMEPKPGEKPPIRPALSLDICNGNPDSLWVRTADAEMCFYAGDDGALCEYRGIACRNLLAGGLKTITLWRPPAVPDLRCPLDNVPANGFCFRMVPVPNPLGIPMTQVDVTFAIRDSDGDLDGVNIMAFNISLTCSGRNC
jgi:prepilin-type N-terminal cleavage/methylation domain-containing protein